MNTRHDEDGNNKKGFPEKLLSIPGVSFIVIMLIALFGVIYYIDTNKSDIIKNFVRIVRYELIFLVILSVSIIIVIHFAHAIVDSLDKSKHDEKYAVSAIVFPIYFMLVIENFSYSMNDVMDLLSSGQPFALLILFLVLGSVVMICVLSIEIIFTRKSDRVIEKAREVVNIVADVAKDLIDSFVGLVKFVTVDYLLEVRDMVCEENAVNRQTSESGGDSNGTENQSGTGNQVGAENVSKEYIEPSKSSR